MTTKGLLGAVEQILDFARDHGQTPHDVLALLGVIIPERVQSVPEAPLPKAVAHAVATPELEEHPTHHQLALQAYVFWLGQPIGYSRHARGIYADAGLVMPVNSRILSYWLVQNPDAGARIIGQCKQGHLFRRVAPNSGGAHAGRRFAPRRSR